ncbi:MAG: hypothetical protein C0506_12190 [Anaerolinea sp.]|nr:hypothetical protein [Anaerolinea sp.]
MGAFELDGARDPATLTPRQMQVLELIAAGRTNAQIAETLGVSLAGAKWHVSEVLSRLGVASREEAAEYWRRRGGLPRRAARAVRALFGVGLFKTVAAGAAAATLGGGVVLGVLSFGSGDNETAKTPPGPIFSEAEARERATYAAGEYLKQTDILQTTSVDGHPLSIDDLQIVELVYFPLGETPILTTVPDRWYGNFDQPVWAAVLRRENVQLSRTAWTDGRMTVTVLFEDGTGKVHGAGARGSSKQMDEAPQPPPDPTRDPALAERVTDYFPVMRLDATNLHTTFNVYQTRGGDWCWQQVFDERGSSGGCGLDPSFGPSPDIFGVGAAGPVTRMQTPVPGYVHGATSARVDYVLLQFERRDPVRVAVVSFPAQTGLSWQAFASVLEPDRGELLAIHAISRDGTPLSQFTFPYRPKVPPYIVQPLDRIDFSGSGDGAGGEFRLPPPAFPVNIALMATHDGAGRITADVVCDTGTNRALDVVGPVGAANGSLIVGLSPGATRCSFVVQADGAWSFVSK